MKLHTQHLEAFTSVSNYFIDTYMPRANGDYVKVYLYLLRCIQGGMEDLSTETISECLEYTEGDVVRALKYWEKEGLLSLVLDNQKQIAELMLHPIASPVQATPGIASTPVQARDQQSRLSTNTTSPANQQQLATSTAKIERKTYSVEELNKLKKDAEYDTTLKVVESYLGHPLSSKELQTATFIYDELHFTSELIYHLYEYCIERGKCRPEYIEQVAISWATANITTPAQAEQASVAYNADYTAVCKAFGLQRSLAQLEFNYVNHWVKELGFDTRIIVEACNRTIAKTNKPEFKYANSILEDWHKKNVHTPEDIARLDEQHKNKQKNTPVKPTTNNRFNQFPQRSYSKEEFADIEKRLLAQTRMS